VCPSRCHRAAGPDTMFSATGSSLTPRRRDGRSCSLGGERSRSAAGVVIAHGANKITITAEDARNGPQPVILIRTFWPSIYPFAQPDTEAAIRPGKARAALNKPDDW
jgi:hypothetical protein